MMGEITALEAEFDTGGTFTVLRGYDPAHRLFRGRRTESYTQMTASDIATKVAQRAGLKLGEVTSTSTVYDHVSQGGTSDWELLDSLAKDVGYEITVREGKFDFTKPASAGGAPSAGGASTTNPLVLRLGTDLLRFRAVVTSAEQVKEVEVRGWDVASKKALTSTAPAKTVAVQLPSTDPAALAHVFGDPVYVATDVPHRTQAEVDAAAAALAEEIAGAFAEFEGVARGNPDVRANAAVTWTTSARRSTASTPSPGPATASTRPRDTRRPSRSAGRTTAASSALPVAGRSPLRAARGRRRAGERRQRPRTRGAGDLDLPLAVRHLRERLGTHRPGRRRQGPRCDGGARGRRRGAGRLRAG